MPANNRTRGADKHQRNRSTKNDVIARQNGSTMRQFLTPAAPIAPGAAPDTAPPTVANADNLNDVTENVNVGVTEDDDGVEVLRMTDIEGTHEPNPIIADFDDDDPNGVNTNVSADKDGIMYRVLKKVMIRLRDELSSNWPPCEPKWLTEYVRDHDFWIPQCGMHCVAKKLKVKDMTAEDKYYLRGIRVWFPEMEGGLPCVPCCPTCGKSGRVEIHSYPLDHPGRRIFTFDAHYYLMTRQYKCKRCQIGNRENPGIKIQYTFMGYHNECLTKFPRALRRSFPAILSHRSGLDKTLAAVMRPLADKGMCFKALSKLLEELHSLRYFNDYIHQQAKLEAIIHSGFASTTNPRPRLSDFNDRKGYNGAIPTSKYLAFMHKRTHDEIRPALDRVQKQHVELDSISIDASFKAVKKIMTIDGKRVFNAVITVGNSIGQIRSQTVTVSDSHEQIEPALQALHETNQQYGRPGPSLAFTDNPKRDKTFLLRTFPSIRITEERLKTEAERMTLFRAENRNSNATVGNASGGVAGTDSLDNTDYQAPTNPADDVYEVIQTSHINNTFRAFTEILQSEGSQTATYFSLDAEWDVERNKNPYDKRPFKGGKQGRIPLIQIGYRRRDENFTRAFLVQLDKNQSSLPQELVHFLTSDRHVFVGVRVKQDVSMLCKDYNIEKTILTEECGRWAKRCGLVSNANSSLLKLSELVLHETLDKSDGNRLSNWSAKTLSVEQQRYAAADAIKSLDIFLKLLEMPDLSLRLDQESAKTEGLKVELCPPHAASTRDKVMSGYGKDHDLTTRAAIGVIMELNLPATMPYNISPNQCKDDGAVTTCRVKITNVLAPSLNLPKFTKHLDGGQSRKACLQDFGEVPFELVVPLTMLREHCPKARVRRFGSAKAIDYAGSVQRRTRPSRTDALQIDEADFEKGEENAPCDPMEDLLRPDEDEEALSADAREEILQQSFDAIRECEIRIDRAEYENDFEALFSDELGEMPQILQIKFSAVLGDIFHSIDRMPVPVKHEFKKAYKVAMMNAFLEWDAVRLEEVREVLKQCGWTDAKFESTLYYNPAFFRRRVPRIALPPPQLYRRVRAVFVTFGNRVDSKSRQPLFGRHAWNKARNILKEIQDGLYSDPSGFNFYMAELDKNGEVKKDKYGITLLRSKRGTNLVESIHRQYNTTFRHRSGIEMGDTLLAERRHRHNFDVATRNYTDYPHVGHYNTWEIDLLQALVEENTGVLLYPGWRNTSDYCDTNESFVTIPIHNEQLQLALDSRVVELKARPIGFNPQFSADIKHLCRAMSVPIPFLPVMRPTEFLHFSTVMLQSRGNFNSNEMAIKWMEKVDGEEYFPKLPAQLREYYKRWERNSRVRKAVKGMKNDTELLAKFISKQVPRDLMNEASGLAHTAATLQPLGSTAFTLPEPQRPPRTTPLIAATMRRSEDAGPLIVGTEPIGTGVGLPSDQTLLRMCNGTKHRRQRGRDWRPRKKRRCLRCRDSGQPNMAETAHSCPGKNDKSKCRLIVQGASEMPGAS